MYVSYTYMHAYIHKDGQTDRQADRQTDMQTYNDKICEMIRVMTASYDPL